MGEGPENNENYVRPLTPEEQKELDNAESIINKAKCEEILITVDEGDRKMMKALNVENASWHDMLEKSVKALVEAMNSERSELKLKVSHAWDMLRAKYGLPPGPNYTMNQDTGEIFIREPQKPKK